MNSVRFLKPLQGGPLTPGAIGTFARKRVELADFSGRMRGKFHGIFLTCTESRPIFPLVLRLSPTPGFTRDGLRQPFRPCQQRMLALNKCAVLVRDLHLLKFALYDTCPQRDNMFVTFGWKPRTAFPGCSLISF
jgi:hypothetical protein